MPSPPSSVRNSPERQPREQQEVQLSPEQAPHPQQQPPQLEPLQQRAGNAVGAALMRTEGDGSPLPSPRPHIDKEISEQGSSAPALMRRQQRRQASPPSSSVLPVAVRMLYHSWRPPGGRKPDEK